MERKSRGGGGGGGGKPVETVNQISRTYMDVLKFTKKCCTTRVPDKHSIRNRGQNYFKIKVNPCLN